MVDKSLVAPFLQSTAGEWVMILSLVFGGCCSNVWALEGVLKSHPKAGTFLTFAQFLYVAIQNLSSQLEFRRTKGGLTYPRLKERKVPLKRWLVQVVLFLAISLMNNYAFGLKIPVTVHIIFRSGGLCVSMLVGHFAGGRRYSLGQVLSAIMITVGIVLATLSAPHRKSPKPSPSEAVKIASAPSSSTSLIPDELEYVAGIALLAAALFLSAFLGLWQESTYRVYGKQWKEALFYGHFLSLPFFLPLYPSLTTTFTSFAASSPITFLKLPQPAIFLNDFAATQSSKTDWLRMTWRDVVMPSAIFALLLNIFTQGLCIRGVNRLTTRVNAVTVNLILTVRKAVSLAISVWYYGSGFSTGLALGGILVMLGTILYSVAPGPKGLAEEPVKEGLSLSEPSALALPQEERSKGASTSTKIDTEDQTGLRRRENVTESRS
ncbi:hypothetical protein CI109_104709 [Kwoniella shandongensis]|uniref:Uncharacterized protein n=1 Tax=Kwoniella shandongensis TaxID=1734106 RepID=A0A5M6BX39_9TREE|nr:uncharacterized protein CI109_004871 [Kwoniella shandongensis]KAA5526871.1 hypothetical protein CI109_004871 [Kwoniella shandongensis]